jgi:hypothetical protein
MPVVIGRYERGSNLDLAAEDVEHEIDSGMNPPRHTDIE